MAQAEGDTCACRTGRVSDAAQLKGSWCSVLAATTAASTRAERSAWAARVDLLAMAVAIADAGSNYTTFPQLWAEGAILVVSQGHDSKLLPGPARLPPQHGPARRPWGMVADADALVADEPDVPVLESVTQESPRQEAAA